MVSEATEHPVSRCKLGQPWKDESNKVKEKCRLIAKEMATQHKKDNPGYRFRPIRKKTEAKNEKKNISKSYHSRCHQEEHEFQPVSSSVKLLESSAARTVERPKPVRPRRRDRRVKPYIRAKIDEAAVLPTVVPSQGSRSDHEANLPRMNAQQLDPIIQGLFSPVEAVRGPSFAGDYTAYPGPYYPTATEFLKPPTCNTRISPTSGSIDRSGRSLFWLPYNIKSAPVNLNHVEESSVPFNLDVAVKPIEEYAFDLDALSIPTTFPYSDLLPTPLSDPLADLEAWLTRQESSKFYAETSILRAS
ncbi:hypothetical protein H0H87_006536 [Tephrocybe sp. NHM501043]|nr:hypothetical protein H0H87_006536 [Tephrocybe sp. NHM501043]